MVLLVGAALNEHAEWKGSPDENIEVRRRSDDLRITKCWQSVSRYTGVGAGTSTEENMVDFI